VKPLSKKSSPKKSLLFAGLIFITLAFVIEAVLFSLRYEKLWFWYDDVKEFLFNLENKIIAIDKKWEFVAVIMILYLIKCVFPIFFTSTVCFITGAVLPIHFAIPVNIIGTMLQFSIKYFWGSRVGSPYAWKIIRKNDILRHAVQSGGKGNPVTLFALRLVPSVPVNTISSIYGSLHFGYLKFIVVSIFGFLPKLIAFTFVGRNTFDPLSAKFLLPLMIILLITGISCLSVNGIWSLVDKLVQNYNRKNANKNKNPKVQKESEIID